MKKFLGTTVILVILAFAVVGIFFRDRFERIYMVATLFSGAEQYQNFHRTREFFPTSEMLPADAPYVFPSGRGLELPASFPYRGKSISVDDFLSETDTAALLVLHEGEIQFEEYWLTGGPETPWLSMSVAKSFISALVGIALQEGKIQSIEDAITRYVPELKGSAYDGVRIKDVLQMSSGARWNEDYSDPNSDINRFAKIFAWGGSTDEFTKSLEPENEPGTVAQYNSADTQALGMLLARATGQSIAAYMSEKIWLPMGAESSGYWLLDNQNMEMAFAGLNATARDYAKLGEIYRLGGQFNGAQIVPADWVRASVTPDAPHLQPAEGNTMFGLGYGHQWWVPAGTDGEFSAIGVYNQFIFVNPLRKTVSVKLSANSDYGETASEGSYREHETIEFFRAITKSFSD